MPFSAEPGRRPVVLSRGDFACLDYLDHQPETYRLAAGIHVDRESAADAASRADPRPARRCSSTARRCR